MKVHCRSCHKSYNIHDEKLPIGKKVSFPCPNCKAKITLDLRSKTGIIGSLQEEPPDPSTSDATRQDHGVELKERVLQTLDDLPATPQVVLEARKVMADPNSGVSQVVKVLETDQAITTRILKVANSAYYGASGKISSVQQASVLLGYKVIGELITLVSSSKLLDRTLQGYGLGSGELWRHSLSVAVGSRIIANRKKPELAEISFSAGLIHDAGKLVLDKYVMERKDEFEEVMEHGKETYMRAEEQIFGFNHAEIGFDVCRGWHIPEEISVAIKYHHAPSRSRKNELAYIVYMADAIVNMADYLSTMDCMGAGIEALMYMLDDDAMVFLGIEQDDVEPIIDEIGKTVEEMKYEIGEVS